MNYILSCSKVLSKDTCDSLIHLFEKSTNLQTVGLVGGGNKQDIKKSTDIPIDSSFLQKNEWVNPLNDILYHLKIATQEYVDKFPYLKEIAEWGLEDKFNFQRYLPNEGYYKLHCEVPNKNFSHRVLSWIIYLNNVEDAGTYFLNENHVEESIQGKIIIFPAYWTHPHKGIISKNQTKYILTGWFVYV